MHEPHEWLACRFWRGIYWNCEAFDIGAMDSLYMTAQYGVKGGRDDVHILFVCTGNTCRSPMAAFLARAQIHAHGLPWTVESAGLFATHGLPLTAPAANALIHRQVPLQPHHSQPISAALVAHSNLILPMTASHAEELRQRFPDAADKIIEFGTFVHGELHDADAHYDIVDPFGQSDEHYDVCATEIEVGIKNLINHWTEEEDGT